MTYHQIFLTLGDRGNKDEAQQLSNHFGTTIRLNTDGTTPSNNPFKTTISGSIEPSKIFSYGHRNIQGAALNPLTDDLWTHEHGPQGGDELNIIFPGKNYGWPVITYGVNYLTGTKIGEGTEKIGMEQPQSIWIPSIGTSGLAFVTSKRFKFWGDNILIGGLKLGQLFRVKVKNNRISEREEIFRNKFGRIRDVRVGPKGFIYLLTDEPNGKLIRLSPIN